ncbi:MAG: dihydroneopterin aldolase [Actinobacteria bacterium]|nr:dihydroneopterin aldolase [Actinomycetota bacterium]MSY16910.1 dihydroneopterin aldolase [Actinomycetota bacterium]
MGTGEAVVSDIIMLTGIRGHGHHGVFPQERRDGQEFIVDINVHLASSNAAKSDALADTVNYAVVADMVHERIIGEPVDLIETLAENIAAAVLSLSGVSRVEVTVHKPQAPIAVPFADVALRIVRP